MLQYVPAFLAAAAALLGALVSWYGPVRNAGIARDNRLCALYGDVMNAMLAINEESRKVREAFETNRRDLPQPSPEDRAEARAVQRVYRCVRPPVDLLT